MNIPRLMQLAINRPLLIAPRNAEIIYSILAKKDGMAPILADWEEPKPSASRFVGKATQTDSGVPFQLENGVGLFSVVGELVNRGAYVGASSGVVSYEGIDAQLRAVASDPRVTAIGLDVESPGGEAVGAMELAATVRKINAEKPVYAFVNGMAASAGYALVSGAKRIFNIESGIVGSIGVVLLHMDYSAAIAEQGIVPTLIHAGAHKVDGNPFEPLSAAVKSDLQAEVMKFYDLFVETVAQGRKMSKKAIRETEARTFIGQDAVDAGLADAVASFDDVLAEITRAAGRSTVSKGVKLMTDTPGAPAATNAGFTQEQVTAAADASVKRISAIVTAEGIAGDANRTKVATKMAATSQMSADEIISFVKDTVPAASSAATLEDRAAANAIKSQPGASNMPAPAAKSWTDVLKSKNMHISQQ